MNLIDSHCHLDFEPLSDDIEGAIERAGRAGITKIINIGTSLHRSKRSVELAEYYPNIWASVGLHPQDAGEISNIDEAIQELRELTQSERVVAIGEIGLDYYGLPDRHSREGGNPDSWVDSRNDIIIKQKELLIFQIELAQELKLPVIIHIRDAWDDFLEITQNLKHKTLKGVIHCYTGDMKTAKKLIDLGFYIGFTGFVTFEQSKFDHIREALKIVPLDRILIETDAPFLAPEPYRGKTNEPAYVLEIAKKVAKLRDVSLKEIAENTSKNTEKLFNIT